MSQIDASERQIAESVDSEGRSHLSGIGTALECVRSVACVPNYIHISGRRIDETFQRRSNLLYEETSKALSDVPEEKVDREYLESEAFFDLVLKAWEEARRTRHDEKISLYAKILAGAVPLQDREQDSPEDYLSVLAELSLKELEVAKAIFCVSQPWTRFVGDTDQKRTLVLELPKAPWETLGPHCQIVREDDLPFILIRLQKTGLIQVYGTTTSMDYPGGAEYVITKTFSKIMHYVKEKWGDE